MSIQRQNLLRNFSCYIINRIKTGRREVSALWFCGIRKKYDMGGDGGAESKKP